jgi:outer membrane biosynthesis protein TonB
MKNHENEQFQRALILSCILHTILVGIFYFELPSMFEKLPEQKDVLTFEIVPISSISNIKNQSNSEEKKQIQKKSKEIKSSKQPLVNKKQEVPVPPPVKEKIVEQKKEILPEKTPKKDKKLPPKKQEVVENLEDPLDSILKNLEKESKGDSAKTPNKSTDSEQKASKRAVGYDYNEENPLSITEEMYIKRLISDNWRKPSGFESIEDANLKIHLQLNENGKIIKYTIIEINIPSNNSVIMTNLLKESVLRAIKKVDTIENLPPNRYNAWKEFTLNFQPNFFN